MNAESPHTNLFYRPDFLDTETAEHLWNWLEAIPTVASKARTSNLPGDPLVFSPPWIRFLNNPAKGRVEAQCGLVGVAGRLHEGPPIPPILRDHLAVITTELAIHDGHVPEAEFKSIYINRYDAGGSINPHWDRDHFGEVVVGETVGAPATLHFFDENARQQSEFAVALEPNSLYAFWGAIRHKPWKHSVDGMPGRRYGVTAR